MGLKQFLHRGIAAVGIRFDRRSSCSRLAGHSNPGGQLQRLDPPSPSKPDFHVITSLSLQVHRPRSRKTFFIRGSFHANTSFPPPPLFPGLFGGKAAPKPSAATEYKAEKGREMKVPLLFCRPCKRVSWREKQIRS